MNKDVTKRQAPIMSTAVRDTLTTLLEPRVLCKVDDRFDMGYEYAKFEIKQSLRTRFGEGFI